MNIKIIANFPANLDGKSYGRFLQIGEMLCEQGQNTAIGENGNTARHTNSTPLSLFMPIKIANTRSKLHIQEFVVVMMW